MKTLTTLLTLSLVFSCGRSKDNPDNTTSEELKAQLAALKSNILTWAERCDSTAGWAGCDTGDAVLFNGLLCASGDSESCDGVKKAQGADGRYWRSEFYIDSSGPNSFSRDMTLGVLLYLATTKDTTSATSWLDYIEHHDYKLCPDDTDGRCLINPSLWGLFRLVWQHLGLTPTALMNAGNIGDESTLVASAEANTPGYQLHLAAVDLYLRQTLDQGSTYTGKAADIIYSKQSANPFFQVLAKGGSDAVASEVLSYCPSAKPIVSDDWAWQRDTKEQAWQHSMGWDCIFMINLLQQPSLLGAPY